MGDSNRPSSMGVQGEQSGCAETLHMCTGRMIHDLQPDDKSEQGDRLPLPAADRFPSGWRSQYVKMMEMTWNSNPHARPSMVTSLDSRSPPHVSASGRHEQGLRGADSSRANVGGRIHVVRVFVAAIIKMARCCRLRVNRVCP